MNLAASMLMLRDLVQCVDLEAAAGASTRLRTGARLAELGYVERRVTGSRFFCRPTDKGREIVRMLRSLDRPDLMPELARSDP